LPAHPQCHALVKVFNKTVKNSWYPSLKIQPLDWEIFLPALTQSYNIATTPFELLFDGKNHYGETTVVR